MQLADNASNFVLIVYLNGAAYADLFFYGFDEFETDHFENGQVLV